jgi:hypothetical protein
MSPPGRFALRALEGLDPRWPALAGRAAFLVELAGAPPGHLEAEAEYAFWALPDDRVLVVERERLVEVLSALAPGQLRQTSVTLGQGRRYDGWVLAEPSRVLGYASGEELLGLRSGDGGWVVARRAGPPPERG